VIVNITTTDGRQLSKQLDYPKGLNPRNPLSDAEIEEKFRALAEGVLSAKGAGQADRRDLESGRSAGRSRKLMALMKADVKKKPKAEKRSKRPSRRFREPRNT